MKINVFLDGRAFCGVLLCLLLAWDGGSITATDANTPTIWFSDPVPLQAGGIPVDFGWHAAPRFVEWNGDGLPDILIGGGDGTVWIIENHGKQGQPDFAAPIPVLSHREPIRSGWWKIGACFADLTGDGLNDLIVTDEVGDQPGSLRLYRNIGTVERPIFGDFDYLTHFTSTKVLPPRVEGRIDVADFDCDGLLDILAGSWDGDYWFIRNMGTREAPGFDAPARIKVGEDPIHFPYNTHPRLFDVDLDGLPDLVSGYNWGDFFFWRMTGTSSPGRQPGLDPLIWLLDARGKRLNVRALTSDDSIPDFWDLNADGILDLLTGGANGKLFVMLGIPPVSRLERANDLMEQGRKDLPDRLRRDKLFRDELFGIHRSMREFIAGFIRVPEFRQPYADWYAAHVSRFPEWLRRGYQDPATNGLVPWLAAQVHTDFVESLSSPDQRGWLADTIGLTSGPRRIWLELGCLYADNDHSSGWQQDSVYEFLAALPRATWDAEVISVRDYLGSNNPEEYGISSRTGVNIAGVDAIYWCENPFPPDGPVAQNNVFSIILAHEITHTIDRWYIQENPELNSRRLALLARAGWVDQEYLRSQVGAAFFQRNPQEFLASIGNQYFGDSAKTLDFACSRFDQGFRQPLNQFRFFAEVMSLGGPSVPFYRISCFAGQTKKSLIPAARDQYGRLVGVDVGRDRISFVLDEEGNVLAHDRKVWNRKPVPVCPPEENVWECSGPDGATGTLDASGSYDPEGDMLEFAWWEQGDPCLFSDTTAAAPRVTCPIGKNVASVSIDDGFDDPSRCYAGITVHDTLPPKGAIIHPRVGECFGPGVVVVVDDFVDQCSPTVERTYSPGPGPAFHGHGDHSVTLSVRDPSENRAEASVAFTIDEVPPIARILAPPQGAVLRLQGQPLGLLIASSDDDGATGGVVHEAISLAGCVVLDGFSDGNGDGLLSDETLVLDGPTVCRMAERCGFTHLLNPELRLIAQDCGGNGGSDALQLKGDFMLNPGLCSLW